MKNPTTTILISIATLVLAGLAIFTAVRLYQQGTQPVAPNTPESEPAAAASPTPNPACTLTFTLTLPSGTPTSSPTASPTASSTPTKTPAAIGGIPTSTGTPSPSLPAAGITLPTVIMFTSGVVFLAIAFLVAL